MTRHTRHGGAGTAGLRGLMGPGFNRMNLVTVQQTTQGLCRYLQAKSAEQLATGGFVIGTPLLPLLSYPPFPHTLNTY